MPVDGIVTLSVFDILGREIESLDKGEKLAGVYSVTFDASRYPSGVYYAIIFITTNNGKTFVRAIKLLLLK